MDNQKYLRNQRKLAVTQTPVKNHLSWCEKLEIGKIIMTISDGDINYNWSAW